MAGIIGKLKSHGNYLTEALAPALGQGVGAFTASYQANKAFDKVMNDPELQKRPLEERWKALESTARKYGPLGQQWLKNQVELGKSQQQQRDASNLENVLVERGMAPEIAKQYSTLYKSSTEGGKTELLKTIGEFEKRGLFKPVKPSGAPQGEVKEGESQFPELDADRGLTPADVVHREDKRETTNIPLYNDARTALRNNQKQGLYIDRLSQLNDSSKLPQGFGKMDINPKSGEIFFPALAGKEAELYEKTINEFTSAAKDSYGARVTNFDLQQFMRRLPRLSNSPEGRKLILAQMKVLQELDRVHEQSLVDTYDHYGVGKINTQQAQNIAEQYRKNKEDELLARYHTLDGLLDNFENPQSSPSTQQERPSLQSLFE
jgi:hypothetical protein